LHGKVIGEKFFQEDIEIQDDDSASFADISIPDFKDGRRGRFIHDFKNNLTTIVDHSAKRCFIYPLDRTSVLPPKSLAEVMVKMQQK
jgi:integral membrane protein 2B